MVETNHHLSVDLNAEEKRSLRLTRDAHQQRINTIMRTLEQYCDPAARHKGLTSATDVRQVLDSQTFTNIPRHMLNIKEMPRHRQADFGTGTSRASTRAAHISPKRLAYHAGSHSVSPYSQGITPMDGALSPMPTTSLATSARETRLSTRSVSKPTSKWTNRRAFTVRLDRQLPLSYDAQCDLRYVTGARRRSSLHLESGFAPLFSKASRAGSPLSPAEGASEWSPQEEAALQFLRIDSELSPRRTVELHQHEKHRWDRKKGATKTQLNTPPHMPDLLGKTLPKDYTPSCVERPTESMERYFEGSDARMEEARERVAVTAPHWNY